ncbi:MAG: cyclic nucleotide-binding domain-containing protein [Candidatus Omnitrophica bacterium]|nr:cyclic nucleotide-binding domain-containing protein [Candidatus Omnitrophota bacterium]
MDAINKDAILKELPLFASLTEQENQIIREKASLIPYQKGQVIYQEGSAPDAFYCIVYGRVIIYSKDTNTQELPLEYLHRGKYFGIISLITGEPHSVSARAMNDCMLLIIKREDFNFVLQSVPRLAIDLSSTLSRRLKNKDIHQKTIFESTIISVFSSYSQSGKTMYALNLALSLSKETRKKVVILDVCPKTKSHTLPGRLGLAQDYKICDLSSLQNISSASLKEFQLKCGFGVDLVCFWYDPLDQSWVKKMVEVISIAVNDYHYVMLDLPSVMDWPIIAVLNQSETIHILTSPQPQDLEKTRDLIEKLKNEFNFQPSKINVLINEYKLAELTAKQQIVLLGHNIYATLPKIEQAGFDRLVLDSPDSEYSKAVRRISRQLGDCLVGLALGVGFAYGLCHIGIFKVFEEENIPIDIIVGSSIGAVIAGLWATGMNSQDILKIVTAEFKKPKDIWGKVDFTFPFSGFIRGNKLYSFLKKQLGSKTFHDVKLPLKIVASDVRSKETRIIEDGLLADAIMASCSMPGVFMPFRLKGIIAVNVTPSKEDVINEFEAAETNGNKQDVPKRFSIKRFFRDKFRFNIIDIIFSSVEVMQSELARKESRLADVVLHPNTKGLHWLELYRAEEFAKRGEEEARKNINRIKQVINE